MQSLSFRRGNVRANQPTKVASTLLDSTATSIESASTSVYHDKGCVHLFNTDSNATEYSLFLTDSTASKVDSNALRLKKEIPAKSPERVPVRFGDDQELSGLSSGNVVVATLISEKETR